MCNYTRTAGVERERERERGGGSANEHVGNEFYEWARVYSRTCVQIRRMMSELAHYEDRDVPIKMLC
jgi:hypothetical protein